MDAYTVREARSLRVLLCCDEAPGLGRLKAFLQDNQIPCEAVDGMSAAISRLEETAESKPFDVAVVPIPSSPPGEDSRLSPIAEIKAASPETTVLVIIDEASIRQASEAFRCCAGGPADTGAGARQPDRRRYDSSLSGADAMAFQSTDPEEVLTRMVAGRKWRKYGKEVLCGSTLADSLDVGISFVDRSHCVRYVNRYQEEISHPDARYPGLCWAEYDQDFARLEPCPWCPVRKAFGTGWECTRTTISPGSGDGPGAHGRRIRYYEVRAVPIRLLADGASERIVFGSPGEKDDQGGFVLAVVEVVREVTESMRREWRSAILEGRTEDRFREEMTKALQRICDLGFDRARLFLRGEDARYEDLFAIYGQHPPSLRPKRNCIFVPEDPTAQKTAAESKHRIYDPGKHPEAVDQLCIRRPGTPWIEVPVRYSPGGGPETFLGRICVDNEVGRRPIAWNQGYHHLLDLYAEILAPTLRSFREHRTRLERARQAERLRALDLELVRARTVEDQMSRIVAYVDELLEPDHCHIRRRQGDRLALVGTPVDPGRVRDIVLVSDEDSISARLARSSHPEEPIFLTEPEREQMAVELERKGLLQAAAHFRSIASCGAFALMGDDGIIGTLVIDSRAAHFFDSMRTELARDLCRRAQVLLESSIRFERECRTTKELSCLLNAIPAEVVVLDRKGDVSLHNMAWSRRAGGLRRGADLIGLRFANAIGCTKDAASELQREIETVFTTRARTGLVANVATAEGRTRQMDVTVAPFAERWNQMESVAVVLSDITDRREMGRLSEIRNLSKDLGTSLEEPLRRILGVFQADTIAVAECLSFSGEDTELEIRCRLEGSSPAFVRISTIGALAGAGKTIRDIVRRGYLAITTPDRFACLPEAVRQYLSHRHIKSFLVVPVYCDSEPWGLLAVGYGRERAIDGSMVDLLRAAATQVGLVVRLSEQMELRDLDQEIAAEVAIKRADIRDPALRALLDKILQQAIELTRSTWGHVRVMDWSPDPGIPDAAVMTVTHSPYNTLGKPMVRGRVPVGTPVSGIVAEKRQPHIANDLSLDPYARMVREGVPPERVDILRDFLGKEKSYACYPLIADDEVLGTFAVSSTYAGHYTARRRRLLEELASRAALALRDGRHLQRMKDMAESVNEILRIDQLDDLWPEVPRLAARLFLAENAAVSSCDWRTGKLRRRAVFLQMEGTDVGSETTPSAKEGAGLTRWIAEKGGVLRLAGEKARGNIHLSKNGLDLHTGLPSGRLESILIGRLDTPQGTPVGVLKVENRKGRNAAGFTELDEVLMDLLCRKLAIAIERLRLMEHRARVVMQRTHDFKTPLHAAMRYVEAFADGTFCLPEDSRKLGLILRQGDFLDALIVSTLDVALGRSLADDVSVGKIDPNRLVDDVAEVFTLWQEQDKWTIARSISAGTLWGDRDMLHRAMLNLVENARKHGLPRSPSGAVLPNGVVGITIRTEGNDAIIAVEDGGRGIPTEFREKLFDPEFVPPEASREGHGIGLAAVRLLAQAHGGDARIGDRLDGAPGVAVTIRWDQATLRARSYERRVPDGLKDRPDGCTDAQAG